MENNSVYQEGLDYMGRGEWAKAVDCFTQLQASYPDDPRIAQFLETARLRAAMSPGLERQSASPLGASWLRRAPLIVAVLVLLAIAAGVYLAYQRWGLPAQAASTQLARLDKLRQAADIQTASGQYADAIQTYQSILAEAPDDPVSSANLARVQKLEQVASLYTQATQAVNAGDQSDAIRLLEQINALEANYRDTASLLDQVQATQAASQAWDQASALTQAGNWQEAAQALELLRAAYPAYKPQELRQNLFQAYLQLGNGQMKKATTVTEVQVAQGYYEKALSMKPLDPQADTFKRLAATFLDGAAAYQARNWESAIRNLTLVQEQQPGYFGGKVAQWLYEAYITTGESFLAQKDPFGARDRFAQAMSVAPTSSQKTEAQKLYTIADTLTTPTPTISPSATPIPTGTPLPAGYVAPAWTRNLGGGGGSGPTPIPYPFVVINRTYVPNTITGEGCRWAGVAGRIFDIRGAPLTLPSLGVRVEGPDDKNVAAGEHPIIGPSGWIVQYDVVAKVIAGTLQVIYKDKPVSAPIPYVTRGSCYENMLIVDIQQVRALP